MKPGPWRVVLSHTSELREFPSGGTEQAGPPLTCPECVTSTASADVSKSDLVCSAGYVSTKKDGMERLNLTAFCGVLLEAKGMHSGTCSSGSKGKPGRSLSYTTKIQFNGKLMVGKA